MKFRIALLAVAVAAIAACETPTRNPAPDLELKQPSTLLQAPAANPAADAARVEHGRYMVEILGCGTCHTDGALIGVPVSAHLLAGSEVGIAYGNPLETARPGVVYPPNLTPDPETGIGKWSEDAIAQFIRTGMDQVGQQHLAVMPWPAYAKLTEDDARAIAAYLRALPPVRHEVPDNVRPGQRASAPFVHFGVYMSKQP